jgi:hypothetical protein
MRRFLILLLSLVVAGNAIAGPTYACVATNPSMTANGHTCCEAPAAMTTVPGACCIVTTPDQRVSKTEATVAPDQLIPALPGVAASHSLTPYHRGRYVLSPVPHAPAVPIYVRQLSLLI